MTDFVYPESLFGKDAPRWEKQAARLDAILPHIKSRRMAIDAGANIGLWSRRLSKEFNWVMAFEPVSVNFRCLMINAPYRNVIAANIALGQENGEIAADVQGAYYAQKIPGSRGKMHFKCLPLDYFGLNEVDFLKIDTDGFDHDVLLGSLQTIRRCKPVICVENFQHNGVITDLLIHENYEQIDTIKQDEIWRSK